MGDDVAAKKSLAKARLEKIQQVEKELVELRERKGPFDRAVRGLTASIRESYESIIFEDQDLATAEAAEQLLWRLHYRCIEEFRVRLRKLGSAAAAANHHHHRRSSAKKRGGPEEKFVRVGAQYKSFLDEVTGFYHGLIAKVRARHGLSPDLSASGGIRMMSVEELQRCQSMCHRCLIYLGDLARYKELHAVVEGRAADWSVAASYYQQSSKLWPHDGNSHNQQMDYACELQRICCLLLALRDSHLLHSLVIELLAVLATYTGDNMQAVYHYFFSLAVATPFVTARANVKLLFEKNQQHVGQLHVLPAEEGVILHSQGSLHMQHTQSLGSDDLAFSNESTRGVGHRLTAPKAVDITDLQRRFQLHFICLMGILFTKTGLEKFQEAFTVVLHELQQLLGQNATLVNRALMLEKSKLSGGEALGVLQLVVTLIFSVHYLGHSHKKHHPLPVSLEHVSFVRQATIAAIRFISQLMHHAAKAEQPANSSLFPAVVIFCQWFANQSDLIAQIIVDEDSDKVQCSFWKEACVLLSRCLKQIDADGNVEGSIQELDEDHSKSPQVILWEDQELQGFVLFASPELMLPVSLKGPEAFKSCRRSVETHSQSVGSSKLDVHVRVYRLIKAMRSLSLQFKVDSPDFDLVGVVKRYTCVGSFGSQRCLSKGCQEPQLSKDSERLASNEHREVRTRALQLVNGMARNSLSECCGREDSASGSGRKETQEVVMLTSSKQVVEVLLKSGNVKDSVRVSTLSVSDGVNAAMVTAGPLILKECLPVSQTAHAIASPQRDHGISMSENIQHPVHLETTLCSNHDDLHLKAVQANDIEPKSPSSPAKNVQQKTADSNGLSAGRQALSLKDWVGCAAGSSDLSGKGLPPTTSTSKKRKATSLLCQLQAFEEAQNLLLHTANPEGIPDAKSARLSSPLTTTSLLQPTDVKLRQSLCIAKNVEFAEDASGSGNRTVNPVGLRTIVTREDILLNNLNEGEQSREAHGVQLMQTQNGILGHPIYQPCHCSRQLSHQDQNHSREIPSLLGHQEENKAEDYSWLDTYTHVKPQALEKLRKATMKSSFSFADFGIFCEFAASATICSEGHGFQPKVSFS